MAARERAARRRPRFSVVSVVRISLRGRVPLPADDMKSQLRARISHFVGLLLCTATAGCGSSGSAPAGSGGAAGGAMQTGAGGAPGIGGAAGLGGHDAAGGSRGTGGTAQLDAGALTDGRGSGATVRL